MLLTLPSIYTINTLTTLAIKSCARAHKGRINLTPTTFGNKIMASRTQKIPRAQKKTSRDANGITCASNSTVIGDWGTWEGQIHHSGHVWTAVMPWIIIIALIILIVKG